MPNFYLEGLLGAIVSRSYVQLLKTHPAEGWVKARYARTPEDLEAVNTMHGQIRALERELDLLRRLGTPSQIHLAQGDDVVTLDYEVPGEESASTMGSFVTNWNELFELVGIACIDRTTTEDVREALEVWIKIEQRLDVTPRLGLQAFEQIKIQFVSLGLIETSGNIVAGQRGLYGTYHKQVVTWSLTPEGRSLLGLLSAARKLPEDIP
jgi:hypothetical protein